MKETSNYWHDPEITPLPLLLPTPESGQLSRTMTQVCSPFFMKWPSNQNAIRMLLLLLLSRFSHVQLCATTETAAHQAPLSLGFSRQEYWSVKLVFIFWTPSCIIVQVSLSYYNRACGPPKGNMLIKVHILPSILASFLGSTPFSLFLS